MAQSEKMRIHMQEIRSQILRDAERLFMRQGYKTTTIRQLVQESGITSGSIYNIYEDKEHLFAALIDEFVEDAYTRLENALDGKAPENKLIGLIGMELYCIENYPVVREMIYAAHVSPLIMESIINRRANLLQVIWDTWDHKENDSLPSAILLSEGTIASYVLSFSFAQPMDHESIRKKVLLSILFYFGVDEKTSKELLAYAEENRDLWKDLAEQVLHHSENKK